MSSKPIPPLIQGVLLALVGIGLVTGSWLWRERTLAFVKSAQHSEATIVKMERARNGNSHFPVFAFKDDEGRSYEVRSSYSSESLRVGDKVEVSYDPTSPYGAVLSASASQSPVYLVLGGMGLVFVAGGVMLVWTHRWWVQQELRASRASEQAVAADRAKPRSG